MKNTDPQEEKIDPPAKVSAVFYFNETYYIQPYAARQEATVELRIDYRNKTFKVVPPYNHNEKFAFTGRSQDYKKWLAVVEGIRRAIEFGSKEVNDK